MRRRIAPRIRAGVATLALLCTAASVPAQHAFEAQVDALLRQGYDRPDAALSELRRIEAADGDVAAARLLLLARGMVQAQSGRDEAAQGWSGALRTHAQQWRDGQAEAGASLVQAMSAHNAGRLDVAASLARAARDALQPYCPEIAKAVGAPMPGGVVAHAEGPRPCDLNWGFFPLH